MRTLYVLLVVAVFVGYCCLSKTRQNHFAMPKDRFETIDIVTKVTPTRFLEDSYTNKRDQHFMRLEKMHLHPAKPLEIGGRTIQTRDVLMPRDYLALAKSGIYKLEVRNPAAVLAFAARNFTLRQDLYAPDGKTLIGKAGEHVSKAMMEKADEFDVTELVVNGDGAVVSINGTMLMVLLIFTAMVMLLRTLLWDPLCKLVDDRNAELKAGQSFIKDNREAAHRLEKEHKTASANVRRAGHAVVMQARHEGMVEAEKIMSAAREEAYRLRTHAEADLKQTVTEAEKSLRADVPALAAEIRSILISQ